MPNWIPQIFASQAFWVFVGVVAGALIQFILHNLILLQQRKNAKKLFRIEIEINEGELDRLSQDIDRKMNRFASHQKDEVDYTFDMSSFNYRMLDPLINTGHFHALLGRDGVSEYFRFANELNVGAARNLEILFRERDEEGSSIRFLEWLKETKIPEWRGCLRSIKAKLQ